MSTQEPQRRSRVGKYAARYVRTVPASIGLAIILIITALLSGTFFRAATDGGDALRWAAGVTTTIDASAWWTPLTALFVPNDPVQVVVCVVFALTLFALAERLLGTVRAGFAFLTTGVIGVIIAVFVQWGALVVGELWASTSSIDLVLDPTVGMIGALMAASAFASALWRRRIRVIIFAALIMFVLYNGDSDNFYRLVAALLGLLVGAAISPGPLVSHRLRGSSHAEARNLVAAVVAVTAIGPVTALLSDGGYGPLAFVGDLFASGTAATDNSLALVGASGIGPILLGFMPLALLLTAALGIRRGRRFAYVLAIIINAGLVVLALLTLGVGDITLDAATPAEFAQAVEVLIWIAAAAFAPAVVILILVRTRRHFRLTAPKAAVRSFVATVVIAFVVLAAAYLIAGGITLHSYLQPSTFGDLLIDTLRRFIPPGFNTALGPVIVPGAEFTLFIYRWVGPIFWIVFILATLRLYRATTTSRSVVDEVRFRGLLKRYGGGTFGFMGTWPGNVYWFSADSQGAVAYRVIGGIAITLSDPVCATTDAERVIREFVAFCDEKSWEPVFYSTHEEYLPVFDELGWLHMSVGEETLMHPQTLEMTGKPWQKVRQALNRGIKEELTTLWASWDELPLPLTNAITAISEQWVSEKALPEMGFTLGGMAELRDPEVKLFLAIGPAGDLQAVTSWLPTYRDGDVVGWTIDFMRRADASIPGIMEFVIASAALHMQKEGIDVLSLSGAPLATKPDADSSDETTMTALLEFLAKTLEPAYGFASLFKFKSKFNPTYSTIYMAYQDPVMLPAIGSAIGKAYLPDASPAEYVALAKTLLNR